MLNPVSREVYLGKFCALYSWALGLLGFGFWRRHTLSGQRLFKPMTKFHDGGSVEKEYNPIQSASKAEQSRDVV